MDCQQLPRVLWLNHHRAARRMEVTMLRELGCDVWSPRYYPGSFYAASPDDSPLESLPDPLRGFLQSHNFYEQPWTANISRAINGFFDLVMVNMNQMFMTDQVLQHVNGPILLRAYGVDDRDHGYFSLYHHHCAPGFIRRLSEARERLWFSPALPAILEREPPMLRERSLTLPFAFRPLEQPAVAERQPQMLAVLPHLMDGHTASMQAYKQLGRYAPHVPTRIIGAQEVKEKKPKTPPPASYVSDAEYQRLIASSAVVLDHSEHHRHLYWHALDAMQAGTPLLFLAEGAMAGLLGKDSPGVCASYSDLAKKAKRLVNGDATLNQSLLETQNGWLAKHAWEASKEQWREQLARIFERSVVKPTHPRSVALVLPEASSGLAFVAADAVASRLLEEAAAEGQNLSVVVASTDEPSSFLLSDDVLWRPTRFEKYKNIQVHVAQEFSGYRAPLTEAEYLVPLDDRSGLFDCDAMVLLQTPKSLPFAPVRPYGVVMCHMEEGEEVIVDEKKIPRDMHQLITLQQASFVATAGQGLDARLLSKTGIDQQRMVLLEGLKPRHKLAVSGSLHRICLLPDGLSLQESVWVGDVLKCYTDNGKREGIAHSLVVDGSTDVTVFQDVACLPGMRVLHARHWASIMAEGASHLWLPYPRGYTPLLLLAAVGSGAVLSMPYSADMEAFLLSLGMPIHVEWYDAEGHAVGAQLRAVDARRPAPKPARAAMDVVAADSLYSLVRTLV